MDDRPTRERIVASAIETIRLHGYAGASARAIAKTGGFNQALIYYYFNDLDDLFVAAMDSASAARMASYIERSSDAQSLEDLVRIARELFEEDIAAGHITVLAEMVAAALPNPAMAAKISERLEPWIRLAQDTIDRFVQGTMLEAFVQSRTLAEALVAFYLGMETMMHLDGTASTGGDRAKNLFDMIAATLPMVAPFLQKVNPQP